MAWSASSRDAAQAGVDGLIIVDLGPEEDSVLRSLAVKAGLAIVRLATPTTDDERLRTVLDGASGFLYYVSVAGVTGTKAFTEERCEAARSTRINAGSRSSRAPWVSASAPRRRPPRSRASPMRRSWVPPLSAASPTVSRRQGA